MDMIVQAILTLAAIVALVLMVLAWAFVLWAVWTESKALYKHQKQNRITTKFFKKIEEFHNDIA